MFFLSQANDFNSFLLLSFGFGLAGSIFAAGVAYISLWYSKEKQGTALGIFGVGNSGAALTTLFAPTLLNQLTEHGKNPDGWRTLPQLYAAVLVAMAIVFLLLTKNKKPPEIKTMAQRLAPLKEVRVWRFGLYYFFVFGSIVTLAQWLIPYYVNIYSLSIVTAGMMVSAFSLPAGLIRAFGGWLSDKVGARTVLLWVFGVSIVCLIFLFPPRMEIRAPGQGIMAGVQGTVTAVSETEIVIDDTRYALQAKNDGSSQTEIRLGIHHDSENDFTPLPTSSFWQEPQVKVGDTVAKGQLLAKGYTHIYFQANKWILFTLIFILGIMMGIGTAAVFKHISDYYPTSIGTVGGIVGVIGGIAGFINPILFGYLLKGTGIWTSCWIFLAVVAALCIIFQSFAIKAAKLSEAQRNEIAKRLQ
jgi:NNP family nitrate/nitrite transporter-like MFS transporter